MAQSWLAFLWRLACGTLAYGGVRQREILDRLRLTGEPPGGRLSSSVQDRDGAKTVLLGLYPTAQRRGITAKPFWPAPGPPNSSTEITSQTRSQAR